jgi:hypothetical protein
MAAGLGFKDFTTGEVLTAADVDGYLMQGVWVFASAAARDAAVTSPQEGNFAYLKDTNVTTYYTGSAWANLDTTGMVNPMTTTGDTIYSSSGSTPARLGIGSTGQVLTVAGGVPSWATPASGSTFAGVRLVKSGNQSISDGTFTLATWDTESFDTNSYHDGSTNTDRITIPSGKAGYYLITAGISFADSTASSFRMANLRKNGTQITTSRMGTGSGSGYPTIIISCVVNAAESDYFDLNVYQNTGGALNLQGNSESTGISYFQAIYLGA